MRCSTILAVLLGLSVSTAWGRTTRLTCRDGETPSCPECYCDADQQCNSVCTFVVPVCTVCRRPVCVGPPPPCTSATVLIPVWGKLQYLRFVLRCLPHREGACPVPECATDADCPARLLGDPCMRCEFGQCVSDAFCCG